MDLFSTSDLAQALRGDVATSSAAVAHRMAVGWLYSATRTDWTQAPVIPPDVAAWALELGVIAYENIKGYTRVQVGAIATEWNYRQNRRLEILTEAHRRYSGENTPAGDFPMPLLWPEPADFYAWPYGRYPTPWRNL